jgi:hypothetical protein
MAQPIQIILMRQLAGYLSVPLFLVGPNGDLLFYNEPAEAILGRGSMKRELCRQRSGPRLSRPRIPRDTRSRQRTYR